MKLNTLKTLILMSVLTGCSHQIPRKIGKINLPELPNIQLNIDAEKDFQKVCIPSNKCLKLDKYLAEMYAFRVKYDIYKEELAK